jgi:hypothetical protein
MTEEWRSVVGFESIASEHRFHCAKRNLDRNLSP